jgi:hypothetical protein
MNFVFFMYPKIRLLIKSTEEYVLETASGRSILLCLFLIIFIIIGPYQYQSLVMLFITMGYSSRFLLNRSIDPVSRKYCFYGMVLYQRSFDLEEISSIRVLYQFQRGSTPEGYRIAFEKRNASKIDIGFVSSQDEAIHFAEDIQQYLQRGKSLKIDVPPMSRLTTL